MSGSDKCFEIKMKHGKGLESDGEWQRAIVDRVVQKGFSVKMYQEKGIILREISQIEKDKYHMISLTCRI